ncbi:DUF4304 domain-containing protein [Mucilaginibacter sp. R11]|uniref:DUF4304 domain-containing protein n=2 Tax=Mucilaginibacter agri TaxID=2695265 RepID=A0A966DVI8_9SPHI|nr:DUF4304 domain-containing protein [Mucilaginibacter agri]
MLTAKEKQNTFIKTYFKPILKQHGYLTNGQTWWKSRDELVTFINLQNFSWNTKNDVHFCFNIAIALNPNVKNHSKPSFFDSSIQLREKSFLTEIRKSQFHRNKTGYHILPSTPLEDFINEMRTDFEQHVLPTLEQLDTSSKCVTFFEGLDFWGDRFKNAVREAGLM